MSPPLPARPARRRLVAATCAGAALLAGCAVSPRPATDAEVADRVAGDRDAMFARQEPVTGPIDYPQAAARALRYNLDLRLRAMEGALASGQLDVARWDTFPRLLASAGYTTRSDGDGSRSRTVETGAESLFHQVSSDRSRRLASAEFSWNALDFGVSYFRARQQADQVLVAEERKRRVAQTLLADVRNAYWRAVGAQQVAGRIDALVARAEAVLGRLREAERSGLLPRTQVLETQRRMLDAILLLQYRRQELELARHELASLMGLPPGAPFTLADTSAPPLPAPPVAVEALEDIALVRRPELREEIYRKRIGADEVRRAMVSALPGLGIDAAVRRDSNGLLLDGSWIDGGVRLSMSLFRLASIPAVRRLGDAQREVDDARRMAQAMAVLTQVRIAALRYGLAVAEHDQVSVSAAVDRRLLGYSQAASAARLEGELELARNEARALLSEYQRHVAYASAQAAWGRILASIGVDVDPPAPGASIAQVAQAVARSVSDWERRVADAR